MGNRLPLAFAWVLMSTTPGCLTSMLLDTSFGSRTPEVVTVLEDPLHWDPETGELLIPVPRNLFADRLQRMLPEPKFLVRIDAPAEARTLARILAAPEGSLVTAQLELIPPPRERVEPWVAMVAVRYEEHLVRVEGQPRLGPPRIPERAVPLSGVALRIPPHAATPAGLRTTPGARP